MFNKHAVTLDGEKVINFASFIICIAPYSTAYRVRLCRMLEYIISWDKTSPGFMCVPLKIWREVMLYNGFDDDTMETMLFPFDDYSLDDPDDPDAQLNCYRR